MHSSKCLMHPMIKSVYLSNQVSLRYLNHQHTHTQIKTHTFSAAQMYFSCPVGGTIHRDQAARGRQPAIRLYCAVQWNFIWHQRCFFIFFHTLVSRSGFYFFFAEYFIPKTQTVCCLSCTKEIRILSLNVQYFNAACIQIKRFWYLPNSVG